MKLWILKSLAALVLFASPLTVQANETKLPKKLNLSPLTKGAKLNKLSDEYTVIQFWASWCVGCGETMKKVTAWTKSNPSVGFVPISVDDSMAEAKSYFTGKNKNLKPFMSKAYLDKGGVMAEKIGISAIPTVILVNKKGEILYQLQGYPAAKDFRKIESITKSKSKGVDYAKN
jgi:thiol-disulfide isomerase/thioredoxin